MLPAERRRAGLAVVARINELGSTVPKIAAKAGVSANTLRRLIRGVTWPNDDSRQRITGALGWPRGEISRQAVVRDGQLDQWTTSELLKEVLRRIDRPGNG